MKKQGRREFKYNVGLFRNRNRVCGLDRPQDLTPFSQCSPNKGSVHKERFLAPLFLPAEPSFEHCMLDGGRPHYTAHVSRDLRLPAHLGTTHLFHRDGSLLPSTSVTFVSAYSSYLSIERAPFLPGDDVV